MITADLLQLPPDSVTWIKEIQTRLFVADPRRLEECPKLTRRIGLSRAQRIWLCQRATIDEVVRSEWSGEPISPDQISVHHIESVLWRRLHFDPLNRLGPDFYNDPYNLIVLSQDEHKQLHPDALYLELLKSLNPSKFQTEVRKIREAVERGEKNWITIWDSRFKEIAYHNTILHIRQGNPWPMHDTQYRRLDE